jgi:hypothetical protein
MVFTVTGTAGWLTVFGVIRYAIPAELMIGVLVVLALAVWLRPQVTVALGLILSLAAGLWTQSAQSRRVAFGQSWYEVQPGGFDRVLPGDVVLVDGQYPSTFLLPGQLPEGVDVHVVQKDFTGTPLQGWLEREIADRRAWVVTGKPPTQIDAGLGSIDYDNCSRIRSNVVDRWLCPLS